MKKSFLFLIAMLLTVFSVTVKAQTDTITIGAGTSTGYTVPYTNYYNNGTVQMIYPASNFDEPVEISGLAFQVSSSTQVTSSYTYYLGVTSNAAFSSTGWMPISSVTQVATQNSIGTTTGWEWVNFSTPFEYDPADGNLVVIVCHQGSAYSTSLKYYYSTVSGINCVLYDQDDYEAESGSLADLVGTSGTTSSNLPNIKFAVTPNETEVTCVRTERPVLDSVFSNDAYFHWAQGEGGTETQWLVKVGHGDYELVTNTNYHAENLNPSTSYTFEVRAYCGEGDTAKAVKSTFKTACGVITEAQLPWRYDFEDSPTGTGNMPDCWDVVANTYPYVYSSSYSSHSGSNVLYMNAGSSYKNTRAILPDMNLDWSNKRIKFWYKNSSTTDSYGSLVFGYVTNVANAVQSFVAMDTLPKISVYTEAEITLEDVPAGARLAFGVTDASYSGSIYVDDVEVSVVPNCRPGKNVHFVEAVGTTVTYAWEPANEETEWFVKYKPYEETTYTEVTVSEPTFTIEGLEKSTSYTYNLVLYAVCDGVLSPDSLAGTISFVSECDYLELVDDTLKIGFEPDETNPVCYQTWCVGGSTAWSFTTYSSYVHSGSAAAYISESNGTVNYFSTPEVNVPDGVWQFDFFAKNNSSSYVDSLTVYYVDVNADDTVVLFPTFKLPVNYLDAPYHANITLESEAVIKFIFASKGNGYACVDDIAMYPAPDCQPASGLVVSSITAHTAVLNWNAGEEGQTFYIEIENASGEYNAQFNIEEPGVTSILLGDGEFGDPLPAQTTDTFTVTIVATCESGEADPYVVENVVFTTACEAISLEDFNEGFENYAVGNSSTVPAIDCWSFLNANEGSYPYVYVNNSSTYVKSGTKSLYFVSSTTVDAYAILPLFEEDVREYRLNFWYKHESATSSGKLWVGYMLDAGDESSFVALQECTRTTTFTQASIDLSVIPDTLENVYVAFKYGGGAYSNYYMGIDDVVLEPLPACLPVHNLGVDSITTTTAKITWTPGKNETEWAVLLKQGGVTLVDDTLDHSYIDLSELTHSTRYSYSIVVKAMCDGVAAEDFVSATLTFDTECLPIELDETHPWSENFNSWNTGTINMTCWINEQVVAGTGSGVSNKKFEISTSGYQNTKGLQLPDMPKGEVSRLTLPSMNIPEANAYEFMIRVNRSVNGTSYPTEGIRVVVGEDTLAFISRNKDIADAAHGVPAEETTGWYQYVFTLPSAGVQAIEILGYSQYGAATNIDDLLVRKIPSCLQAESIVWVDSLTTTTSASFKVTGPADDGYKVIFCGKDTVEKVIAAGDSMVVLENLKPSSAYAYQAKVISNCVAGEATDTLVSVLNFATACVAIDQLPYSEGFEDFIVGSATSPNAVCWEMINAGNEPEYPSYRSVYVNDNSTYVKSGSKSLYFYQYPNQSSYWGYDAKGYEFAVLPEITADLSGAEIKFSYKNNYTSATASQLFFGYFTEVEDVTSFVTMDTLTRVSSWAEKTIALAEVPAAARLAFKYGVESNSTSYFYAGVDDIMIREIPTCFPGTDLQLVDSLIGQDSVVLAWTPFDAENLNAHIIVVNGKDTLANELIADTTYVLKNLQHSTSYKLDVTINTVCSDGESTDPLAATFTFQTECGVVSAPLYENFELGVVPACWEIPAGVTIVSASSYPLEGNKRLQFATTNNVNVLLPEFDDLNNLQFSFVYRSEGTGSNASMGMVTPGYYTADAGFVAVGAQQPRSYEPTEVIVTFDNVPAGARPAINYANATSDYWFVFVDSVRVDPAPACHKPVVGETKIGVDSVTFTWTGNSEKYVVNVKGGSTVVNDTVEVASYTIYGLTPATVYTDTISIQGICGEEKSRVSTSVITFTTECVALTLADMPLVYDFEDDAANQMPICWSKISTNNYPYVGSSSYSAHGGEKYLYLYGGSTVENIAVLPAFADSVDLNALRLKFWYKNGYSTSSYAQLIVGTMSDPEDESTFVAIETLDRVTSYTQVDLMFSEIPADHKYFAFKHAGGSYTYGSAYVDDIELSLAPTCKNPSALAVDSVTTSSAVLTWAGEAENYKLIYSLGETTDTVAVEGHSFTFEGLNSSTMYTVAVSLQAFCSETDSSEVVETVLYFMTECDVISAFPWSDDFEAYTTGKFSEIASCYSTESLSGDANDWEVSSSSSHSGSKHAYAKYTNSSAGRTVGALNLPTFNLVEGKNYVFSYWMKGYSSASTDTVCVYVNDVCLHAFNSKNDLGSTYKQYFDTIAGAGETHISFTFSNLDGYYVYLDDIKMEVMATCFAPEAIEVAAVGQDSVVLTWAATAESYKLSIEGVCTDSIVTDTVFVVKGLSAATAYTWTVAITGICGADDESVVAQLPVEFSTECGVIDLTADGASWTTGFEVEDGFTLTSMPICYAVTNDAWSLGTGHNSYWAATASYEADGDLTLPTFGFSDDDDYELAFYLHFEDGVQYPGDTLKVLVNDTVVATYTYNTFEWEAGEEWMYVSLDLAGINGEVVITFAYTASLDGYQLSIDDVAIAKGGVITSINGVSGFDSENNVRKIVNRGHVYILRGGKLVDMTGRLIK